MKFPTIRYKRSGYDRLLNLHLFDGTCRSVAFKSDGEMAAAFTDGRALVDCTAIEHGILPRGAKLVSCAAAVDPNKVLSELSGQTIPDLDPLDVLRLRFSQKLITDRSGFIDEARDAKTRMDRPDDARRYEALVDALDRTKGENNPS